MTAAAAKTAPVILRNAAGEPPLGIGGLAFRDDQGEMFEHDNPRYRSPAARIGVLELDDGQWLAHPPGFRTDAVPFATREAALRSAISHMVRKSRKYMRAIEGEGTHWTEGYAGRVIEWALSLKPASRRAAVAEQHPIDERRTASGNGVAISGAPAAPRPLEEITPPANDTKALAAESPSEEISPGTWCDTITDKMVAEELTIAGYAASDAGAGLSDPVVKFLVEQHSLRKQFPAKHIFSMTTEVADGCIVTVATCACKQVFKFGSNDPLRMNAAIEAHWRRFSHEKTVDGRGQPINAAVSAGQATSARKSSRKRRRGGCDIPDLANAALPEPASANAQRVDGAGSSEIQPDAPEGIPASNIAEAGAPVASRSEPVPSLSPDGAGLSVSDVRCERCEPAPIGAGSDEYLAGIMARTRRVDDLGSVQDALKMSSDGPSSPELVVADQHVVANTPAIDDIDDLAIEWPSYQDFLEDKIVTAPMRGIEVARDSLHPWLKPHCKDLTVWALRLGCAAIFANFGLHKTAMQLEWCRQLVKHTGQPSLNVVPLGVRHGFIQEALQLGMDVRFVRTTEEFDELYCEGVRYFLTNYESIREGKLDPNQFGACSLDEASVLRSYGSKTYQEFLPLFAKVEFKLVATATPSPNRYKELIHYAGFLGVMDTGLALTRWFQRNSEKAGDLTLYPHKEDEFWMWIHSWAAFLQRPSELGYSDEGYELPPLKLTWHEVPADHTKAEPERDGQGVMFRAVANSLQESAKSRRDSLPSRVAKMIEIIAQDPASHRIIWHDLEAEREAIEDVLPRFEYVHWGEFRDGNPHARALYDRHYSARPDRDSDLILGPGDKMVLLTSDRRALFGWRKFKDDSGQTGVNCAVFRNEGDVQSSDLIKEAMSIAWLRWPGERFYTFVDAEEIASVNPGFCFKQAGWQHCGKTQGGLDILEALPGCDVPAVARTVGLATITGSMDIDDREVLLHDFEEGRIKYFGTKPILSGSGSNFQYHCHKAVYVGMPGDGHKFNDFIQSLYRLQRFGQQFPVEIDIIYSEDMRAGRASLETKWALDSEMRKRMSEIIKNHGLNTLPLRDALLRSIGVQRVEIKGENFIAINNDAVAECRTWPENSVDEIITSIPFGNQYEYSARYEDFGHSDDSGHFWGQMDFLTSELLRMLKPGRLACIHVKDRVLFGSVTGAGVPTVSPFHCEAIMHYRAHGFDYCGMITVVTDVVRENNQTYRLGWSENAKDGTKMGVGMPEYILLLRKPQSDRSRSYADVPVVKSKEDYTRARWQVDAHAFWRSSGNRHLTPEEFALCSSADLARLFSKTTVERVYDFEAHIAIGEAVDRTGTLPATFMAIAPGSHHPDVWHDINRMRTLNMLQQRKGAEMHLCPLQFDIVDRLIERYSNEGDLIFDPFGGLMTVPYRALLKKRRGAATELSATYFLDGLHYLHMAEEKMTTPQLFDLAQFDAANTPPTDVAELDA